MPRVVCDSKQLHNVFRLCSYVVPDRTPIEAYRYARMSVDGSNRAVSLLAGSRELMVTINCKQGDGWNVQGAGELLIPVSLFCRMLSLVNHETPVLIRTTGDGVVVVDAGNYRVQMNSADPSIYPVVGEEEDEVRGKIKLPVSVFRDALARLCVGCSRGSKQYSDRDSPPFVSLEFGESGVDMVSVNRAQMVWASFSGQEWEYVAPRNLSQVMLLLGEHVEVLSRCLKHLDGDSKMVGIALASSHLVVDWVDNGLCTMRVCSVAGGFPNWRVVLPRLDSNWRRVRVWAGELASGVNQAVAMVRKDELEALLFRFSHNRLRLSLDGSSGRKAVVEVPVEYDEPMPLSVCLDGRILQKFLDTVRADELVTIVVGLKPMSPVAFEISGGFRYFQMPLELGESPSEQQAGQD